MGKFTYNEDADVWGRPQIYKGINIYPILVRDKNWIEIGMQYFNIPKNNPEVPETIRMGYLQFLIRRVLAIQSYIEQSQAPFEDFLEFLKFICKDALSIEIKNDGKDFYLLFDGHIKVYNSSFDQIRTIFFKQNNICFDEITSPSFAAEMKKAREIWRRQNKDQTTFQEDVVTYHCETGVLYQDIEMLTWWQFRNGLSRIAVIKQYEVWAAAVAQSFSENKPKIPSWNSHIKEASSIESFLIDIEDVKRMN